MTDKDIEKKIIKLLAADRISKPVSSMKGKFDKMRPNFGNEIADVFRDDLEEFRKRKFESDRVYARVEDYEKSNARGMKEGINKFKEDYSEMGKKLQEYIDFERQSKEVHVYFGINEGKRLTSEDYMQVMRDLKISEATAKNLYPALMDVSRDLANKRKEKERSVLIGPQEKKMNEIKTYYNIKEKYTNDKYEEDINNNEELGDN